MCWKPLGRQMSAWSRDAIMGRWLMLLPELQHLVFCCLPSIAQLHQYSTYAMLTGQHGKPKVW